MIQGCNMQFWSLAAPAYSAVMSMLELSWCVQLIFTNRATATKTYWYPWNFVEKLPDNEAVMRYTVVCFILHLLWLTSSLILIFQIKTPKRWTTMYWLFSTFLVTMWSVTTSIYFMVRLNDLHNYSEARQKVLHNSYLVLLLIFSGGFLFCFINIILLVYFGRKWLESCIFCSKTDDSRGFYNPLSNRASSLRDYNDNNSAIQMDDVIFDAREFRVNKIFHINDGKLENTK